MMKYLFFLNDKIQDIDITLLLNKIRTFFLGIPEIYGVITCWTTIFIIILSLLEIPLFSKKHTKSEINKLKRTKKYIPELFVEVNDVKEQLRYFVYGSKWKAKLIDSYNAVFNNHRGRIMDEAVAEKHDFKISHHCSLKRVFNKIDQGNTIINKIDTKKCEYSPDAKDSHCAFSIYTYTFKKLMAKVMKYKDAMAARYIVLTSKAGNGKTNLLCSLSEMIMTTKHPVVFINGRDIEGSIEEYMVSRLSKYNYFSNHTSLYFSILNIIARLRLKKVFILIDAVNENEDKQFKQKLADFISQILKYGSYRIIVTCRDEYFSTVYEKYLIDDICSQQTENQHSILHIELKEGTYPNAAVERLINVYKKNFEFSGYISSQAKYALCKQLFLLRIFFEVNKGSDASINDIRKPNLILKYIDMIHEEIGVNVRYILDNIADIMLANDNYDSVSLSELRKRNIYPPDLDKVIDSSILINKTIITKEGTLTENKEETICFVFDEIRDFMLARKIANKDTEYTIESSEVILSILAGIIANGSTCSEGLINYIYEHFKTSNDYQKEISQCLCRRILELVSTKSTQHKHSISNTSFLDMGINAILSSGLKLEEFEKKYIGAIISNNNEDGHTLLMYIIESVCEGGIHDFDDYLDILENVPCQRLAHLLFLSFQTFYGDPDIFNILRQMHEAAIQTKKMKLGNQISFLIALYVYALETDEIGLSHFDDDIEYFSSQESFCRYIERFENNE